MTAHGVAWGRDFAADQSACDHPNPPGLTVVRPVAQCLLTDGAASPWCELPRSLGAMVARRTRTRTLRTGNVRPTRTGMEQSNQGRGRRLALPGGRAVGYDEHGPADGRPIFYFHGVPSSRLDFQMFAGTALAERLGVVRLTAPRPIDRDDADPDRRRGR